MDNQRPYCLTIAGFDPSAGAGLLADIKTFEQLKTYGLAVSTALTFQNDEIFEGVNWHNLNTIKKQLLPLRKYPVKAIKIGLTGDSDLLLQLLETIKAYFPNALIIWDPILRASAGYQFYHSIFELDQILDKINLITPNLPEFKVLELNKRQTQCAILLKGGHQPEQKGTDVLITNRKSIEIKGKPYHDATGKHGTGCILSAAITANIALGETLESACQKAKKYVEKVMLSTDSKLGYHFIQN